MDDKALSMWEKLNVASKSTVQHLDDYFHINLKKEKTEVCDSVSLLLLQKDPKNVDALEWNAQKYYDQAEKRYEEQMEIYNQNKTTQQYRTLLKQLDLVTADFKKALSYFEKLWEIDPDKKYAGYLANIYTRFGDDNKAEYYKKYFK
jgi:tetratricopeptide (TPR) repeat protein